MPSPAVSVIMSVYNGARFLDLAIDSVLAQDFTEFEFIVLDDGSSDASPTIIRELAARDARIVPILRENRGLIASLNEMIEKARAPIIARMDADDICQPTRFTEQVAFLEAHPDYGVVGTWSEDIGEHGEKLHRTGPDHPVTHEELLSFIPVNGPLICHPAAMYRREVVRSVGSYHAAFRHCEDLDLWLRLAGVTKLGNIPRRLLRYRRYGEQVSSRHATEQQYGAAVAHLAWRERAAGRPDPTQTLESLPPVEALDELFAREGVSREVRSQVAHKLLYSRHALGDGGFALILEHVRDGGDHAGLWRTVVRLLRYRHPLRAAKLAAALCAHRPVHAGAAA